jgi:hypothetical protein
MSWFDSRDRSKELHLLLSTAAVLAGIGLVIWDVVHVGRPFDLAAYGQGVGLLLAGGGLFAAGQGWQRKAEGGPDAG